jgi:hypothetical protein
MNRPTLALFALTAGLLWPLSDGVAQDARATSDKLSAAEVEQLVTVHLAVLKVQDSLNTEMAHPRNKTAEGQVKVQEQLREGVSALIAEAGLTPEEFRRRRFVVSTNDSLRTAFEALVSERSGVPIRATASTDAVPATPAMAAMKASVAADAAKTELPSGPVGAHLGHVLVSFANTPDKVGLLTIAQTEAGIASQHAALAAGSPDNLAGMQRHAGHVLHALDPSVEANGPGKGYGLKKAATGVAAHIELAAKADGAAAGVKTHATHVAAAARSTVARADEIIALAKQIQGATDAAAAAALVGQLVSLCEQLTAGVDLNADGRVNWGEGEGGLQQAETHAKLALTAANGGV